MSEAVATPQGTVMAPSDTVPVTTPVSPTQPPAAPAAEETVAPLDISPPPDLSGAPDEEAPAVQYNPTGDTGLDLALQFVGALGFGPSHPAIDAATKGDFSKLETVLKGMGDKAEGYERYLGVAKDSYDRAQGKVKETQKASETAVLSAVGGASNWNQIQKWAAANAEPDEARQINAALNAGPLAAAAIAAQLAQAYKASGQSTIKPNTGLAEGASGGTGGGNALSPTEYKAELAKLQAKIGYKVGSSAEYAELQARRKSYKG